MIAEVILDLLHAAVYLFLYILYILYILYKWRIDLCVEVDFWCDFFGDFQIQNYN